jgi:alpha-L-fucosidase
MYLKKLLFVAIVLASTTIAQAQNDSVANAQHQLLTMPVDSHPGEKKFNPHPLAAWFPKAGLGLFIHWGAISTYGGVDISWGMLANKPWDDGTVTPNFYYSLMDTWNPQKFNPDELIKKAKAAGFEYVVFVTKHHDGYTLWPSKYGDLGTQSKLKGRDFVKQFVDACRKNNVKVGLYYSPPDWWFDRKYRNWSYDENILLDMDHKPLTALPQKPADHDAKRKQLIANQVRELLTNYGRIDLIWFDGGAGEISNDEVRKLQPGIIVNRRNNAPGDYGDSEGMLPAKRFNGWFETCDPIWPTRWWSYSTSDHYDDAATILSNLIKLRAWGGNYLCNLAPDGDGAIPQPVVSAMQEMAKWMQHSKEAVVDVEGGNYPEVSKVPVTVKKNVLYAFALPGYQADLQIGTPLHPQKVILLRTGQSLTFKQEGNYLLVKIPPKDRTRLPDVVKIVF